MKTLILLSKSDHTSLSYAETLRRKGEEVGVVLIQDAVYLALNNNKCSATIGRLIPKGIQFHLLAQDAQRRGVLHHLTSNLDLMDHDQLVDLLFQEDQRVVNL